MQTKPEDRPKIIGLIIAIVLLLIVAFIRLIPAFTGQGAETAAASNPALGPNPAATSVTPAGAENASIASATAPGNPGQMRRFDDTMDTDAPVGAGGSFGGGHTDAFRVIAAPIKIAEKPPTARTIPSFKAHPAAPNYPVLTPTQPVIQMIPAPPLEVVLDGVYQAGQERVAQLTILPKGAVKDAGGKSSSSGSEQTVYRRVGEYIGRFKIARLTETGLALAGQRRSWTVGETEKLDEGMIRAPQAPVVAPPSQALPILLPR